MADASEISSRQRPCGIIPVAALCPLCRYRHNGHWTGSAARLDRDLRGRFGSQDYAREELRAEIAQMMVCGELGIADQDFSNNAAYVASWLETLRSDRKEIFRAAADAQRIADYLLAFHPD
jgi:antirestriction protein ArdC